MNRARRMARGFLIVALAAATIGCSKILDRFREKHPDPPPGVFPRQVGKMVLEENERWGKTPNCTRADPLHCWAYYVLPGGDDEKTRVHYYVQIYDSPGEAYARLDSFAGEMGNRPHTVSWEDGGPNVGRLMIKNTIYQEADAMFGYCSVSYAKDTMAITIFHGYECDAARQFMKDLVAITQ